MNDQGLGKVFVKHLVMASSWGIVFLVVFAVGMIGIKQQVKESNQYTVQTALYESVNLATNPDLLVPVKQNVKEGVEFLAQTARREFKTLLSDPELKQDVKEAVEYTEGKMMK